MAGVSKEDEKITREVNQKLANRGVRSPCQVNVSTTKGVVTLTGNVQQFHQKKLASNVSSGVQGVLRVVDNLSVLPPTKRV